mmetsp:Transcript_36564/g.6539  ORF Transcript_36564/g.6539 Transcript_36564/m.6539 type:complete len:119 (+) Transcript_36564:2865-3221(+)
MLDFSRILLLYVYISLCMSGFTLNSGLNRSLLSIITMISWMRVVSYVRIYNQTRYMIRIIIEIFKDMISFLLILAVTSTAFALIFYIAKNDKNDSFTVELIQMYRLDYGDFVDYEGFL